MTNEFNDASIITNSTVSMVDSAPRENAVVEASLSPDVVERVVLAMTNAAREFHNLPPISKKDWAIFYPSQAGIYIVKAKAAIAAIQQTGEKK